MVEDGVGSSHRHLGVKIVVNVADKKSHRHLVVRFVANVGDKASRSHLRCENRYKCR